MWTSVSTPAARSADTNSFTVSGGIPLSISAKLPEQAKETGIEIPATAVFSEGDAQESFVWVIHETSKKLSRRGVEVGQLSRFGILIRSGLQPGEWIVTKGVHSVEEGETIRMIDASKEDSTS